MEKPQLSPALEILSLVWKHVPYPSHEHVNRTMQSALTLVIDADIKFEENDFEYICKNFRPGYWIGTSPNGKHMGDWYYATACNNNKSAAVAYEFYYKRTPFIAEGKRCSIQTQFVYNSLYCHVTGWGDSNDKINFVGYDESWGKGTRKLFSFDKKEWLSERKQFKFTR